MEQIKSLLYRKIANPYSKNVYGLEIIIIMQTKCLYFDSSNFYFVKLPGEKFNKQKWNVVSNFDNDSIIEIREDELSAYFIIFANRVIMYIYQELDGDECIRQMFKIVNPNDNGYHEVEQHLQEKWIETLYNEDYGIDNIMARKYNNLA